MTTEATAMHTCTVVDCNGTETQITYTLQRKRVKNINLRIHQDGTIFVSAHPRVPLFTIESFIRAKIGFIQKAQERFSKSQAGSLRQKRYVSGEHFYLLGKPLRLLVQGAPQNRVETDGTVLFVYCKHPEDTALTERLVKRFFSEQCTAEFTKLIDRIYPLFQTYGIPYPALKIRTMTSRWGSCIPAKKQITLNATLIHYPERCIISVIVHEFCHFRYPNHSKDFYAFMTVLMPDWKERKKELNAAGKNECTERDNAF